MRGRAVLFLSAGRGPLVAGAEICGAESGAGGNFGGCHGVGVVERRSALRHGRPGRLPEPGRVAGRDREGSAGIGPTGTK